ncbi:hypothetical protein Tco_0223500 [Tanacetum coccineum]
MEFRFRVRRGSGEGVGEESDEFDSEVVEDVERDGDEDEVVEEVVSEGWVGIGGSSDGVMCIYSVGLVEGCDEGEVGVDSGSGVPKNSSTVGIVFEV